MPATETVVLDTDTLSELSRGHPRVVRSAREYLAAFGRFTITAVTVFERLRGYRAAIRAGKPFEAQLQAFEALVANCIVLPFDHEAAAVAAEVWSAAPRRLRARLGDVMIVAIAASRGLPIATRNRRDFVPLVAVSGTGIRLVDWAR